MSLPSLDPGQVTAVAAIAIGLLALFVSIWEVRSARRYHRLTVTPLLVAHWNVRAPGCVCLVLSNHGLGPAIIRKIALTVDRNKLTGDREQVMRKCRSLLGADDVPMECYWLDEEQAILPSERVELLTFPESADDEDFKKKLQKELSRLAYVVRYASVYDDERTLTIEWGRDRIG